MASDVRNTLSELEILDPNRERTPRAKAMSVAVGIAQPRHVSGVCQLIARKISAGAIMPPRAAMNGSARRGQESSSPTRISRLISRPTSRKNSAISPSLIQCSTSRPATFVCSNAV
jgi:hypothetical protein